MKKEDLLLEARVHQALVELREIAVTTTEKGDDDRMNQNGNGNGVQTLEVEKFAGDITNCQLVGGYDGDIVVMQPKTKLSKAEALVHAAWIVALADESENYTEFRAVLKAVLET